MQENREVKLAVNNLKISFRTDGGNVQAVRDISFKLYKGETLAIVGESGSGKSVTTRAVMGILAGNAIKEGGEIIYDGQDLMKISEEDFHKLRGDKIAMIFQDPMSSLNPIMRVGKQLTEAMRIKGKNNQKTSRRQFNAMLAAINAAMDEAGEKDASSAAAHKKMCADFNRFEYKHLELENAYNRAKEAAEYALEEIDDVIFRLEKRAVKGLRADVKEVAKFAAASVNKYVVDEEAAEIAELSKRAVNLVREPIALKAVNLLKVLVGRAEGDKEFDFEAVKAAMERIKDILSAAVKKPMPNFFAMGYYVTFAGESLPDMEVEELNKFLRKYLDEHFMLAFIEAAGKGVKLSHERAVQARRAAVDVMTQKIEAFRGEFDKKQAAELYRELVAAVKNSIDKFEVVKDNLSYTFASSLKSAIDQYFGGIARNAAEEERFARQTARYEKLVAAGKKPQYEVAERNLVDLPMAKQSLVNVIERLKASYVSRLENDSFDENAATIAVIDYLKEKASGVAHKVTRNMAKTRAIKLLKEVGISEPARRYRQYPFEFSGGMRQRIVIAIALSADPDILICDEPTTALDVTIQSQILELINKVKVERDLSVIFITHDLGVVANMADRVAVMYAGKIVEIGTAEDIFYSPAHPYTWALLSSMPDLETKETLEAIPGTPPNMIYPPKGDAFAERNKYAMKIDFEQQPPMFRITDTHYAATWLLHPDAPKVEMPAVIRERIERLRKARRASDGR